MTENTENRNHTENTVSPQNNRSKEIDKTVQELELTYGAHHVILIFIPVFICMLFVVVTISSVNYFSRDDGNYLVYTPFHPKEGDSGGQTLLKSVLNALIVLAVVVVMTFVLICLYKIRCYKVIHIWIIASSLMLLFMFAFIYIQEFLKAFNIAMDLISVVFCLYNFGVVGMVMIHWKGPLLLQQSFLIVSAALMSLVFIKYLPEWTLWLVLGVLACWDLCAVLAPHGPLRILVETAAERGESIMPALIYSSTVAYPYVTMVEGKNTKHKKPPQKHQPPLKGKDNTVEVQKAEKYDSAVDQSENKSVSKNDNDITPSIELKVYQNLPEEGVLPETKTVEAVPTSGSAEEKGVKLGLGDFIFYSVLVGKASAAKDPLTTIACFIAILMGLFLTLAILVTAKKALPALPISIFLGLVFNFGTSYCISPMVTTLASHQIFT